MNGLLAEHRVAADDIESLADRLVEAFSHLVEEFELPALIDALDAKFIPPVSGGDLIRTQRVFQQVATFTGLIPSDCRVRLL